MVNIRLNQLEKCELCPRKCGVNRYEKAGFCGETDQVRIARADLHFGEEPCIIGQNGSGTIFFSGCSLKCCFCQNFEISSGNKGFVLSTKQLADTFLMLQEKGCENINLVNPTHFVPQIISALEICGESITVPIIYNCGGYENVDTIVTLKDYVDIFLPDFKYYDDKIAGEFSKASDYFENCSNGIKAMFQIAGKPVFDKNGKMLKGVIVRHLILPSYRHDSIKIIDWIGKNFKTDEILVSLMSQYTPIYKAVDFSQLNRRVTTFEYNSVVSQLQKWNFNGYIQEKSSASDEYIPEFFSEIYYKI